MTKNWLRRTLRRTLFCHDYDLGSTILLTGSPRSGSTWLAQAWHQGGYDIVDEPLNLRAFPEAEKIGFEWRTYIPPDEAESARSVFMRNVLTGRIGYVRPSRDFFGLFPTPLLLKKCKLIVKCVRANRMLAWITNQFPIQGAILLIRHPCAVVSSQVAMGVRQNSPWKYATKDRVRDDPYSFGGTIPSFLQDHFQAAFETVRSREGYLARILHE